MHSYFAFSGSGATPYLAALLSGPLAHYAFWIRFELDAYTNWIILGCLVLHAIGLVALQSALGSEAARTLYSFEACHVFALSCSILTYRIYFHPLRQFLGNLPSKLSTWGRAWELFRSNERGSLLNHELHLQHGDIVRTGPNQISIRTAASVPLVHGSGRSTVCHKAVSYMNPVNPHSVNAEREPGVHFLHRKKWDKALDPHAAIAYLPKVRECINTLSERLRRHHGRTFEINEELHLFAFDLVGAIGFGLPRGFRSMETGYHNPILAQLISMIRIGVYMMLIPWLHVLTGAIPTFGIISKADVIFRSWVEGIVEEKYAKESLADKSSDIVGNLMRSGMGGVGLSKEEVVSDAVILNLAVADTTFSSMVHASYRLARHPETQERIRQEVGNVLSLLEGPESWAVLSKSLPYTEGFFNELLRLHPPTPTSLPRTTPPEGLLLDDGTYIPGGVDVTSPIYSLHRDPRYFVAPESFIPERWIAHNAANISNASFVPQPHLVLDRRAFLPFLRGPYRCAGSHFAYVEMKMWLAQIVSRFDISLPEGVDLKEVDRKVNLEWRDYTMTQPVSVHLRFVERL